jgi:hypothetical protein
MRIRSIRPEFWRSEDVSALDWHTRLVFIGLWSYVDDNGVGIDRDSTIAADLFADDLADDPRETLARVHRGLAALSARGMVTRYTVDRKAYLHIASWAVHQRIDKPGKSRYPLPTSENAELKPALATPSRESLDISTPGEGEKGRRGEGEKYSSSAIADAIPDATRPDVEELLDHLDARIVGNGSKAPARTKRARDAMRLLLDKDGRTVEQIHHAIDWCQDDTFWRANILSAPKLREKYDQLRLAASRPAGGNGVPLGTDRQALILRGELERAQVADATTNVLPFPEIGA